MIMAFSSALASMRMGHRVKRKFWDADTSIGIATKENDTMPHFDLICNGSIGVWLPTTEDILSNDWMLG